MNKNDAKKNGVVKTLSEPLGKPIQQPIDDVHFDSDNDFSQSELPMSSGVHSQRALTSHVWEPVSHCSSRTIHKRSESEKIPLLNRFAHMTKVQPKKIHREVNATVRSELEFDRLLATHPTIASLPSDKTAKQELASLSPKGKRYVYVMMDSGASLHAAWLAKHFPGHTLFETEAQKRGEYAETANGQKLYNQGGFMVEGECDGVSVSIGFTNMKVNVPICSVGRFVKDGHNVSFFPGGGLIQHREAGTSMKFIELGGVYFLKIEMTPKNETNEQGFHRLAP